MGLERTKLLIKILLFTLLAALISACLSPDSRQKSSDSYYIKNDCLYFNKNGKNSVKIAENVYEYFTLGNRFYFITRYQCEKSFDEIFKSDNSQNNLKKHFSKIPFNLYILYEANHDIPEKIDDEICDISCLYDNGRKTAIYKKLSGTRLNFSKIKSKSEVYDAIASKYEMADIIRLNSDSSTEKLRESRADYFEVSDRVYYLENKTLYGDDEKIAENVDFFKATKKGVVYSKEDVFSFYDGKNIYTPNFCRKY